MAVFASMMAFAALLLGAASSTETRVGGREAASLELKKAHRRLEMDLIGAQYNSSNSTIQPGGCALWFRSALDPATGEARYDALGEPYWQRNVLYYLSIPVGDGCAGGLDKKGMDDRCPHKLLLRKRIDVVTEPVEQTEPFLASVTNYLTKPTGLDVSAMRSETGVDLVEVVAKNLLSFEVDRDNGMPCEIGIVLRAVSLQEANKSSRVGVDSLKADRNTLSLHFGILPRN